MKSVNPKLLIALAGVVALAVFLKLGNPHKKYSQQDFWKSATVEDVNQVPQEALLRGNKNGPVLMWAATTTKDPRIIAALVERGADVNEPDAIFSGTPLSAAAGYSSSPAIIDELIRLGAEIDKVVGSNNKTPLIIASEINPNPKIVESLIRNGADTTYRDLTGRTALEQAIRFQNSSVIEILKENTK
jgi:ankyrin repeat protein